MTCCRLKQLKELTLKATNQFTESGHQHTKVSVMKYINRSIKEKDMLVMLLSGCNAEGRKEKGELRNKRMSYLQ